MSRLVAMISAVLCAGAPLTAQDEHTFYNQQKTKLATRGTTLLDDQIYFLQPITFRNNGAGGLGWRIVVQDQEQSSAEILRVSWHAVDGVGTPVAAPIATAQYAVFGVGSGIAAYIFTLATAIPITLPQEVALGIFLPKPHPWPGDATTLHYQRGDSTLVPLAHRVQATFVLSPTGQTVVPEWVIGSTFRWGGLYDMPVLRAYTWSARYGTGPEALFGPECLRPDPLLGDRWGLDLSGIRFRSLPTQLPSVACLLVSDAYRPLPLPTPFGVLLLDETRVLFTLFTVLTDGNGNATIPAFGLPGPPLTATLQAAFASLQTLEVALSNGIRIGY